jgi:hypothetical protein
MPPVEVAQPSPEVDRLLRKLIRRQQHLERRQDERIPITIVIAVMPMVDGIPQPEDTFVTLTKNLSSDGASIIVNKRLPSDDLIVGLPGKGLVSYIQARVVHRRSMALGCEALGLRLERLVTAKDYRALAEIDCGDLSAS